MNAFQTPIVGFHQLVLDRRVDEFQNRLGDGEAEAQGDEKPKERLDEMPAQHLDVLAERHARVGEQVVVGTGIGLGAEKHQGTSAAAEHRRRKQKLGSGQERMAIDRPLTDGERRSGFSRGFWAMPSTKDRIAETSSSAGRLCVILEEEGREINYRPMQ